MVYCVCKQNLDICFEPIQAIGKDQAEQKTDP